MNTVYFAFAGPTQAGLKSSGNKESSKTGQAAPAEGETKKANPGENIDSAKRKPKMPRKAPAGGKAGGRALKMTIVDVALAAARIKREAKLRARDMLKSARGLTVKGRFNR